MSSVSPSSSRKVVRIETAAVKIGTKARNEANTKASTIRAPKPPTKASSRTPGPSLSLPLSSASASKPVRCTGSPAIVMFASAALAAFSAAGFSPNCSLGIGRRVDDRVHGAPVVGDERVVAGRGVGGDPRSGQGLLQPGVDLGQPGRDLRRVHALPLGQSDHGQQRSDVAAGALVALGYRLVGLPALLRRGPRTPGRAPRRRGRPPSRRRSRARSRRRRRCACGREPSG